MAAIRRRLSIVSVVWILLQISGTAAPLMLAPDDARGGELLCTCPGEEHGAACPMHHPAGSHSGGREDEARCRLQNACAPADIALLALAAGSGVPTPRAEWLPPLNTVAQIWVRTVLAPSRLVSPDSPPPRR